MPLSTYLKKLGFGSILIFIGRVLNAIAGEFLDKLLEALFYGTATTEEVSTGILISVSLGILAYIIFIYGIRSTKHATEKISRIISDLSGLPTGYNLFFWSSIGLLIIFFALLVELSTAETLEEIIDALIGLVIFLIILAIALVIGLILIGLRTKNLSNYGINVTGPSYLILIGAILVIFFPTVGSILLLIGFLRLGIVLYNTPIPPADIVSKIAEELQEVLDKENLVNLVEFSANKGYPLRFVLEAAFGLAEQKNYAISRGVLIRHAVI